MPHFELKTISIEFKLYLSGPIEMAKQILRRDFLREGLCVTIDPTLFIYTGGEEAGYVVGLRNYPRFPSTLEDMKIRAEQVAVMLLDQTYQHSVMIVGPHETVWITKRQ